MNDLLTSLVNWGTKLVMIQQEHQNWGVQNYCKLFVALLNQIQPQYFSNYSNYSSNQTSDYDFIGIYFMIKKYYRDQLNIQFNATTPIRKDYDINTIINLFKLIFGLGLRLHQQKIVLCALQLDQNDQKNLMSFIESARNYGIQDDNKEFSHGLIQDLQQREQQNKYLRERNQQLQHKLKQVQQTLQIFKEDKAKILQQLNLIKNQKYQLAIQLGLTTVNPSYGDILSRYKQKQYEYEKKVQQLQKQCERKMIMIQQKSNEVEQLKKKFNINLRQDETIQICRKQIQHLNDKIEQLQRTNKQLKQKCQQEGYMQQQKDQLIEQNRKLKASIVKYEKVQQKYKELKKIYKNFQKNIKPQIQF